MWIGRLVAGWLGMVGGCSVASFLATGTFTYDSGLRLINLVSNSGGVIEIRIIGIGVRTALGTSAGGFATGLSRYGFSGGLVQIEPTGGAEMGAGCSIGAR